MSGDGQAAATRGEYRPCGDGPNGARPSPIAARRKTGRRPAPTGSPPICARIAGISPTPTSPRSPPISTSRSISRWPPRPEMQGDRAAPSPHAVCLVPKSARRTTEGGRTCCEAGLAAFVAPLRAAGARVSIFIGADRAQIAAAHRIGAPVIESHTGGYYEADIAGDTAGRAEGELARLTAMAAFATDLGLRGSCRPWAHPCNVGPIAAIPQIVELNIGHFLIGEAIFVGLEAAIRTMRAAMDAARPGGARA